MATMDDIAKRLGISKGTVSKALNGAEDVSEAMRKAVLETAVELRYSRIPRSGSPTRICIFIENTEYKKPEDFGWELVTGFRKMAEPDGYVVDLIPLDIETQKKFHYDEYMLRHKYKGAFFIGITFFDPWIQDFATCCTPTVLFDNHAQYNPVVTQVSIDNDECMEMAIAKLKSLGHETIGYLSGDLGSYVFQQRYSAFFRALKEHGLKDDRDLAGYLYYTNECLEKHFPRLMKLGCTAIICSHDLLAHALMIRCREQGIRIPEDLSVIGIDDLPFCRYTTPPLSSMRQDRTNLGKGAYYALSSQMDKVHIGALKLHPELILRDSIGPAPKVAK